MDGSEKKGEVLAGPAAEGASAMAWFTQPSTHYRPALAKPYLNYLAPACTTASSAA